MDGVIPGPFSFELYNSHVGGGAGVQAAAAPWLPEAVREDGGRAADVRPTPPCPRGASRPLPLCQLSIPSTDAFQVQLALHQKRNVLI